MWFELFEERSVYLPPVTEARDGLQTRLIVYGVNAREVDRVDFVVFG